MFTKAGRESSAMTERETKSFGERLRQKRNNRYFAPSAVKKDLTAKYAKDKFMPFAV